MKLKIAALLLATASLSNAVIVKVTTGFDKAVASSTGAVVPDSTGFVGLGYFSIGDSDLATTSSADLSAAFTLWGTTQPVGFSGVGGSYEFNADAGRIGAASSFLGKNYYTVVGNGASLATSTELLIFKHAGTFPNDADSPIPANPTATLGVDGQLLMGRTEGTLDLGGGLVVPAYRMGVVVPEPSTMLLGLVGALGFLRRKR